MTGEPHPRGGEGLTIHQLLQTGPHHVDVLNPTELELDVRVVVVILVPFPSSLVGHGVDLQQTTNNIISLPCSLQFAMLLIYNKQHHILYVLLTYRIFNKGRQQVI